MVRAGTSVTVGERLGEGGQGVVHAVTIGGAPYAVKWYRYAPSGELRKSIAALVERGRPHRAFIWPIDLVVSDELSGFGYVMPRLEPRFSSFAQLVSRPEQPPFRVVITIGRHLVTAFEALHSAGLCYRDISFGNLWVDADARRRRDHRQRQRRPGRRRGLRLGNAAVHGARGGAAGGRPVQPDRPALARRLLVLPVHARPSARRRARPTRRTRGQPSNHQSETDLALRHFGTEPVFIFDPDDHSNPPRPGDPVSVWWRLYPKFFRAVFERAFTSGLRDPSGLGRVAEGVWRRALVRLADCVSVCSCQASVFYDPDDPGLRCWNCNQVPPRPPLLELPGAHSRAVPGRDDHAASPEPQSRLRHGRRDGREPSGPPWRARAAQYEHEGLDDDAGRRDARRPSNRSDGSASGRCRLTSGPHMARS